LLRTVINFVCLQDVAECRSRLVVRAVGSAEAKFVIGRMSYLLTFGHVASSTFCCWGWHHVQFVVRSAPRRAGETKTVYNCL